MGLDDIDECDPPFEKNTTCPQVLLSGGGPGKAVVTGTVVGKSSNMNHNSAVQQAPVDLGDLFSDLALLSSTPAVQAGGGVSNTHHPKPEMQWPSAAPATQQQQKKDDFQFSDPLDAFFTAPTSAALPNAAVSAQERAQSDDIFDFSKPAVRTRHADERTFLEAFEKQGKGLRDETRDGPSLADLSKGSSDNRVKARLLKLMNYYDVLGVTREATEEQIRQQYKKKALELHPDRVGRDQTPEEAELFKVMTKAHEILCDTEERTKYDAGLMRSGEGEGSDEHWLFHLRPQ
ncbi:putative DnaJ chaperone protein [Trypanosoma grayi]|uniref:putative DnaJ chaperone protein n=1 Tax=Trypanosoma grayi TaxID=71804 RepID=UPI0004F44559|nr:putative DnaJ chaperone protein [Trypanosoma grayi]KEG10014.1 putative DnaJ chaperone protein [Trypanosoma grayi]